MHVPSVIDTNEKEMNKIKIPFIIGYTTNIKITQSYSNFTKNKVLLRQRHKINFIESISTSFHNFFTDETIHLDIACTSPLLLHLLQWNIVL